VEAVKAEEELEVTGEELEVTGEELEVTGEELEVTAVKGVKEVALVAEVVKEAMVAVIRSRLTYAHSLQDRR